MSDRKRHPHKAVEEALRYAEARGWKIAVGGHHAWGKMYCPDNSAECRCGDYCITCILSTPKNPETHAKLLRRVVDNCSESPQRIK
ncbi:hypothetical protein VIJ98_14430 [Pantoea sp. S18]|nr:hypothetical protein [Pantoea sp. S18]MEA5104513.1 hypothetical protein [Pantoea sp. S18]